MAVNTVGIAPADVAAVRSQFPLLSREVHGRPLVYLDSAATSQKPVAVLEQMERYYRTINSNVHRGVYAIAEEATNAVERARNISRHPSRVASVKKSLQRRPKGCPPVAASAAGLYSTTVHTTSVSAPIIVP